MAMAWIAKWLQGSTGLNWKGFFSTGKERTGEEGRLTKAVNDMCLRKHHGMESR